MTPNPDQYETTYPLRRPVSHVAHVHWKPQPHQYHHHHNRWSKSTVSMSTIKKAVFCPLQHHTAAH
jgi:hypothetical protein